MGQVVNVNARGSCESHPPYQGWYGAVGVTSSGGSVAVGVKVGVTVGIGAPSPLYFQC